jgi:hypothetical protein
MELHSRAALNGTMDVSDELTAMQKIIGREVFVKHT